MVWPQDWICKHKVIFFFYGNVKSVKSQKTLCWSKLQDFKHLKKYIIQCPFKKSIISWGQCLSLVPNIFSSVTISQIVPAVDGFPQVVSVLFKNHYFVAFPLALPGTEPPLSRSSAFRVPQSSLFLPDWLTLSQSCWRTKQDGHQGPRWQESLQVKPVS